MIFGDPGPARAATEQGVEVQSFSIKSGLAPRPEKCKDQGGSQLPREAHVLLLLILPATSYWLGNVSLFLAGQQGEEQCSPENFDSIFDWKVWVSGPISMAALTLEQKLELGASDLRFLLTNHGIQDAHQGAPFEAGVDTMAKFAAFVTTAADLVEVLKKEFSLDPATSLANRAQAATKQQAEVEATSETREWAKPIPVSDFLAMQQRFAKAFGEPEDKHIPAKEYIEKKLAELEAGEFRAETLGEVLSRDEVDPDVLVPHWDAKGHLSVKKGSSSVAMPTGPEQLRLRLTVMYNALAMIKLKHPGRNELTDINADLIEKYKDYLLGDYVYGLRSAEAAGSMIPPWTLVLGYEHAIREVWQEVGGWPSGYPGRRREARQGRQERRQERGR